MSELLVELRGDGFPGAEVEQATAQLKDELVAALRDAGLPARQSATGCSGRRMMVLLRGMPEVREGEEARRRVRVRRAIEQALPLVSWRQPVEFGDGFRWGAPVHGVLALLDGEAVPARVFGLQAGGASVGPLSKGGRRLVPQNGDEFARLLHQEGIEVRLPSRRARLLRSAQQLAASVDAELTDPQEIEPWAAAYETPSVVLCRFADDVADLPDELVRACLRERQQAIALARPEQATEEFGTFRLASHFLVVVDRVELNEDQEKRIRRGNERAARAHLEDARFHFERDLKTPLAQRIRLLSDELDAREARVRPSPPAPRGAVHVPGRRARRHLVARRAASGGGSALRGPVDGDGARVLEPGRRRRRSAGAGGGLSSDRVAVGLRLRPSW